MLGSLGGSDTWPTVLGGRVGDGELAEVLADHVELDFDVGEGLAVVDSNNIADHFRHDDGVAEVSLDGSGLLSGLDVLLGLSALHQEPVVFVLDFWITCSCTSGEPPA